MNSLFERNTTFLRKFIGELLNENACIEKKRGEKQESFLQLYFIVMVNQQPTLTSGM